MRDEIIYVLQELANLVNLKMYTSEETAKIMHCSVDLLKVWRELEMLAPIKTSKNFMYTHEAISKFQKDYAGLNVSNKMQAVLSHEIVKKRKEEKQQKKSPPDQE